MLIIRHFTQLLLCARQGFPAKSSKAKVHEDDDGSSHSRAKTRGESGVRASRDGLGNGYPDPIYSKADKRQNGELGHFKGNEKLKGDFDDEAPEANGKKVNYHRNSSSESGGEKIRMSEHSPSHDRLRSRSRSTDHTRDRSRSRSIVDEYAHPKRRYSREPLYHTSRHKTDCDLDEERVRDGKREHRHGSIDLVEDDRREHSTRYHSREARDRGRSRDRDVERELHRERKRAETSRNKEVDLVRKREKERQVSHEKYRRDGEKDRIREREEDRDRRREKERDRSLETVFERDRRREKERDRSRDRARGGQRDRVLESERDYRNRERDNIQERERRDDRYRHTDRDFAGGKDKYLRHEDGNDSEDRYRKHSRREENEYHAERRRNSDSHGKVYNSMGTTIEEKERYFIPKKILLYISFLVPIKPFLEYHPSFYLI